MAFLFTITRPETVFAIVNQQKIINLIQPAEL